MKTYTLVIFFILIVLSAGCQQATTAEEGETQVAVPVDIPTALPTATNTQIVPSSAPPTPSVSLPPTQRTIHIPPPGRFYHGVFPGGITGEEDVITLNDLHAYEQAAGKTATWVYFSHNWYHGRKFPTQTAEWIRDAGSIPYVRLMMRSDAEQNQAEPTFTLERIINGEFDADLRAWARGGRDFGSSLMAEFGTEVNGEWFSWNGVWNGSGTLDGYGDPAQPDGPERFRDAYRHIIQIARDEGAANILWVFHANNLDVPDETWNRLEQYYPGDEWIDWIGVSVYGALTPVDEEWLEFRNMMDEVYPRLAALSPGKPIVVLEFGATSGNPLGDQAVWAENALTGLTGGRWPRVIGFSWWNEKWQNDDNPAHDSNMRLQDNPRLSDVFQKLVGRNEAVLSRIPLDTATPTASWWKPALVTTWQWQLSQPPVDQSLDVNLYDIDLFDNESSVVAALHALGRKVICYISVGSWEDWRPDKDQFPTEVIGKDYEGWPGEKWLDIRQIDQLAPIMRARLDLCRERGFDGIEPDNIDAYTADTGFPLTADDQLKYNLWLADEAHKRGLSIGLKNDSDQAADLEPYFDWALTEDCFAQDWCEQMSVFIQAGKPVFAAEYTDSGITLDQFCPRAKAMKINAMLKNRNLDAYRQACP